MRTLAAVLFEQGRPPEPVEVEVPAPGVGQVLVEMEAAGICGAQLAEASGARGPDPYLPHLLGHEGVGRVLEVGPGVRHVTVGDRVVAHWRPGRGIDAEPPRYRCALAGNKIGAGPVACFAREAVVSENRLTPIGPDVPAVEAATLGCMVTTAFGLVWREARVEFGEDVLVTGVGGVGLAVCEAARMAGAGRVVSVDLSEARRVKSLQVGATPGDLSEELSGSFDVVVDCTGFPGVVERGLELLRPGGRLVLVGQPAHGKAFRFADARRHYVGKTILDSRGGLSRPAEDVPRLERLSLSGRLQLWRLVGRSFPLEDVVAAFLWAASEKSTGRTMLVMR